MPRVLQLLSQRPSRTGSGVTLDALAREARRAGWESSVVVGTPADDPHPEVADLPAAAIHPLVFGGHDLPFDLPGMSDVMPYRTSVFSRLDDEQLTAYRSAWRQHVARVVADVAPDVIHAHHVWLLAALVKDVAPDVPLVIHGHATGLRQMGLVPRLATEVAQGCGRSDGFLALTSAHAEAMAARLGLDATRMDVVGAGYRDDLFGPPATPPPAGREAVAIGKLSRAKGLPWLLEAFAPIARRHGDARLHLVGGGDGAEADAIRGQARAIGPQVVLHGRLPTDALVELLQRCPVFVLPSLYEGLPLVVIEALASGCRAVCSDLPGVRAELSPRLGELIEVVPLPRLKGQDEPVDADLPAFVDGLEAALERALAAGRPSAPPDVSAFTWSAVFGRVEAVWRRLLVPS